MRRNFLYKDISFEKHKLSDTAIITGDITNRTGQDYNSVVFRIAIFARYKPLTHVTMAINGFCNGQTKRFEKQIPAVAYKNVAQITGWTIDVETAY